LLRFDKSTNSILHGRNAAMYVNLECKKRDWELEFEEVTLQLTLQLMLMLNQHC
jgi:hypothetical protein